MFTQRGGGQLIAWVFRLLQCTSSCRPLSGGWKESSPGAGWEAPCWSLSCCHGWLWGQWGETLLCSSSHNMPLRIHVVFLYRHKWLSIQTLLLQIVLSANFYCDPAFKRPANFSSRVQKQPLGRQLLPWKVTSVTAHCHVVLLSASWENISSLLTRHFIGDCSPLLIC